MNSSTKTAGADFLATHYNDLRKDIITRGDYAVSTGSANAYILALDAQIVAYETGMRILMKANFTITGSPTINVNSIGVKNIVDRNGLAIKREMKIDGIYELVYNGTSFVLMNGDEDNYPFGDGSDGDVTISSNTNLIRDMFYNNLTVNTGIVLNPSGFAIYVKGTLTLTGTAKIQRNGNNASGQTGGTALATGTVGPSLGGVNGGASSSGGGNIGTAGVAVNPSYATTGKTSGQGGTGGNGGNIGATGGATAQATQGILYNVVLTLNKVIAYLSLSARGLINTTVYGGLPSSSGGGSGGGGAGATGGYGGGSGGNAGLILIFANTIAGTGTIEGIGGQGGVGQNGFGGFAGGGGGGAGGQGALVVLVYRSGTPWTMTLTGGTPGAGGSGGSGGTAGATGANGTVGQSVLITY